MSRETGVGSSGGPPPLVLILSPTRELALQIAVEAKQLCTFHKLGVVTLVGGTSVDSDRRALNRPSGGNFISFPQHFLTVYYTVSHMISSPDSVLVHTQYTIHT
jgi:DEAD/DEAH box helicase